MRVTSSFAVLAGLALTACDGSPDALGDGAFGVPQGSVAGSQMPPFPAWVSDILGKRITDVYPGSAEKPEMCLGYVDALVEYYSGDAGALYEGWGWSLSQSKPYSRLVVTDAEGVVRGASVMAFDRPDVLAAVSSVTDTRVGFAVATSITSATIKIYGINEANQTICAVGTYPAK